MKVCRTDDSSTLSSITTVRYSTSPNDFFRAAVESIASCQAKFLNVKIQYDRIFVHEFEVPRVLTVLLWPMKSTKCFCQLP